MLDQWLDWTLDETLPSLAEGHFPSGRYQLHAPGILELTPHQPTPDAHACVFSAAIHGNETAPVELIGEWLCQLEAGLLTLGAPILVMLGNIPALKQQQRFIDTNLNRLFKRGLTAEGDEPDRARVLMAAVDDFFDRHDAMAKLHYDLHTAIRVSRYPRFVVEPFADSATAPSQWEWLAAAGMQAVLHQHQHSWTFSHYSKHYHAAQAFTFELGRVAPFGHNDLIALRPMQALLGALSTGSAPQRAPASQLTYYRVEQELMRQGETFSLCFADDVANFSRFEPGSPLAHDSTAGDIHVGETPLWIVFPNVQVEIGARAALLVAPCTAP